MNKQLSIESSHRLLLARSIFLRQSNARVTHAMTSAITNQFAMRAPQE